MGVTMTHETRGGNMRTINAAAARFGRMSAGRRGFLLALSGGILAATDGRAAPTDSDPWPVLAGQIFPGKTLQDDSTVLAIDAPYRAEDAAVVPVTVHITLPADDQRQVHRITLVIDANPSPLAAVFTLAPRAGIDHIATRVRVDDYTNIHAVAEMSDGTMLATARFVKASGGCSAPALKQAAGDI